MRCRHCFGFGLALAFLSAMAFGQYYDAADFAYTSNGTVSADTAIAKAISLIPAGSTGIVDATRLGTSLAFSGNPFRGVIGNGASTPPSCGVLLMNAGATVTVTAPIVIPNCWQVENLPYRQSGTGLGTQYQVASPFPACIGAHAPCSIEPSTVSTPNNMIGSSYFCSANGQLCQMIVSGQGTSSQFNSTMLYMHFAVCIQALTGVCNGGTAGSRAWGLIVGVNSTLGGINNTGCSYDGVHPCLLVSVPLSGSGQGLTSTANTAVSYVIGHRL